MSSSLPSRAKQKKKESVSQNQTPVKIKIIQPVPVFFTEKFDPWNSYVCMYVKEDVWDLYFSIAYLEERITSKVERSQVSSSTLSSHACLEHDEVLLGI
jgi:hypothetical protein